MKSGAIFSKDKRYRYRLHRIWDKDRPYVLYIGLNPSTADAKKDDATIRRLIGFSRRSGYGGFYIVNLFAHISPDFRYVTKCKSPIESPFGILDYNMTVITATITKCKDVVFMWGNKGNSKQSRKMIKMFPEAKTFKLSQSGNPVHPLFLPNKTKLIPFNDYLIKSKLTAGEILSHNFNDKGFNIHKHV